MTADRADAAKEPLPASIAAAPPTPAARQEETAATAQKEDAAQATDPPLPDEEAPPLPDEAPPTAHDDGWDWKWAANGAIYFINSRTGAWQWENPRMPATTAHAAGSNDRPAVGAVAALPSSSGAPGTSSPPVTRRKWGGYNPAIHGSYDPKADYALEAAREEEEAEQAAEAAANAPSINASIAYVAHHGYATAAHFNRFTGKMQQPGQGPEMHNDENKSRRQMNAFFDVDAAANSHDGRSLKQERRNQHHSKEQIQEWKDKRRNKKEEKRRAWLRD